MKLYTDIGHGNRESILWVLNENQKIVAYVSGDDTHASVWDIPYLLRCWRGRFDPKTREISIMAPERCRASTPDFLIALLESRFGKLCSIWAFSAFHEGCKIK